MPDTHTTFESFKMLFGSLYQRLLVAAGAVAFLVVNWFCKPARRRPPYGTQDPPLEAAPEREALLESGGEDEKGGNIGTDETTAATAGLQARELSHAEVSPEDVLVEQAEAISSGARHPFERRIRSTTGPQPSKDSPSSSGALGRSGAAKAAQHGESPESTPVDEDYLKSFLDRELGPPKFAVRKQTPEPQSGSRAPDRTLEDLLDQAFGPPRFAVPKTTSPSRSGTESGTGMQEPPPAPVDATPSSTSSRPSGSAVPAAEASAKMTTATPGHGAKRSAQELESDEAAEEATPPRFAILTLVAFEGPASGKRAVADDPEVEYKIGRLPDSWLQVLDQEVSGRHASLRWDGLAGRWMLRDAGSLNGTSLNSEAIGKEYKVVGDERPLAQGDEVLLGSFSKLRVELAEGAAAQPTAARGAKAGTGPATAKRHHGNSMEFGAELLGSIADRSHQETVAGLQGLPSPGALLDYPQLGARLCVHNRLGYDHKRMSQGCEDVPHWELPFEPYTGAGIVCIFDGHHGSKAANQAKEHLPAILRAKLLRRDGRQPPPLPPPPPPPPRRSTNDEEEDMIEAYDGASSEDVIEEDPAAEELAAGGQADGSATNASAGADSTGPAKSSPQGDEGEPEHSAGSGPGGKAKEAALKEKGPAAPAGDEQEPQELLPPPPAGPPLPPLLRGRDMASQRQLLKDTFLQADEYMSMEEGCTATLVMLDVDQAQRGWTLQSANVGDSSAVLVNLSQGSWCKLSEDHRIASSSSERERLARMGHTVRTRLYGLNISRMLGDRFLKEEDLGFLAEPFVGMTAQVGANDHAFLVVASDGLWDVLPEDRAAMLLLQEASKPLAVGRHPFGQRPTATTSVSDIAAPPAGASAAGAVAPLHAFLGCHAVADLLLTKALALRSKDDITIAVLELGPHLWPAKQQS